MKTFSTLKEAKIFLGGYMPSSFQAVFSGAVGLKRTKFLLKLLGNPQERYSVVHIAGTSGKGSTAYYSSELLRSAGFRTGLSLSPHLLDIRERVNINGTMLSREKFCAYLSEIFPAIEKTTASKYGRPTYFEILTTLAFYTFFRERVEYAVMETGLGGLLDATNAVSRRDKVAVITRIGLDHTAILGKTLSAIAVQKAGIIQYKNETIALVQKSVWSVFLERARKMHANLYPISLQSVRRIRISEGRLCFDIHLEHEILRDIILPTVAKYQAENALLAIFAFRLIAKRDGFSADIEQIQKALAGAHFRGRMDVISCGGKTILLDGAHNPQKMRAFLRSLSGLSRGKILFLVAFKRKKEYEKMLAAIIPKADRIVATNFLSDDQNAPIRSASPKGIVSFLKSRGFYNVRSFENPRDALLWCLSREKTPIIAITGSLHFLGTVYPMLRNFSKQ